MALYTPIASPIIRPIQLSWYPASSIGGKGGQFDLAFNNAFNIGTIPGVMNAFNTAFNAEFA